MRNRRGREGDGGIGTFVTALMIIGVVVTTSTLYRESPVAAAGPAVAASQGDWARALASYTTLISLRAPLRIPAQWPAPWYM
jgi:hypothetical protein